MPEEDSEDEVEGESEDVTDDSPDQETAENDNEGNKTESSGSTGTVQLSVRSLVIGVFVLGIAVGFAGGVLSTEGASLLGEQPNNQAPGQDQESETVDMSQIDMEGEPVLGEADAPVTMVIYEDFQCPFCKRFETETFPQIKENFVDSGQVKVVWKDFPAPSLGHDWAEPAAAAVECVYRQDNDAFWNVKEKVFSQAKTLTRGEDEFTPENIQTRIKDFASEEGVSSSAVQSCIDNGNPMDEVNQDKQNILSITSNIGTPTAIINGEKVVGAQPYPQFESTINEALN